MRGMRAQTQIIPPDDTIRPEGEIKLKPPGKTPGVLGGAVYCRVLSLRVRAQPLDGRNETDIDCFMNET